LIHALENICLALKNSGEVKDFSEGNHNGLGLEQRINYPYEIMTVGAILYGCPINKKKRGMRTDFAIWKKIKYPGQPQGIAPTSMNIKTFIDPYSSTR
jgi:hypothetical protein